MIAAIAPAAPLGLQDADSAARRLHVLLSQLQPTSQSASIIYFQPQPRTPGVIQMLGQFREINRQSKSEAAIALSEFNTGLYFLSWQQFTDADTYLRKARLFWSLINHESAGCLAQYALGYNQFLALNYVPAMGHLQRARRGLDRLRRMAARGHETSPPTPRPYLEALHQALTETQRHLQTAMQSMWQGPGAAADRPVTESETPSGTRAAGRPPGSYETGAHIAADFPAEPVIDPRLRPQNHFVAPAPGHVPAGLNYQWVQVTASSGNFIPDVRVGDWLYIHTLAPRQYQLDDLLVIGSQINGSVRVEARGQRTGTRASGSPFYLAKFVRNTNTGRILLLPNEQRQLVELDANVVLGSVVGIWHEVQLQDVV